MLFVCAWPAAATALPLLELIAETGDGVAAAATVVATELEADAGWMFACACVLGAAASDGAGEATASTTVGDAAIAGDVAATWVGLVVA